MPTSAVVVVEMELMEAVQVPVLLVVDSETGCGLVSWVENGNEIVAPVILCCRGLLAGFGGGTL